MMKLSWRGTLDLVDELAGSLYLDHQLQRAQGAVRSGPLRCLCSLRECIIGTNEAPATIG